MLPTFLVIGAQKAGSSFIARLLAQHPDIYMCEREIHFFNLQENYRKGLDHYRTYFKAEGAKLVGEKTPNYFWTTEHDRPSRFGNHLAGIETRIHASIPQAKLIVCLRDPAARFLSAFNHYRRHGQIPSSWMVADALRCENRAIADQFGLLEMGYYAQHLESFYRHFDSDRLLVLFFEEDVAGSETALVGKLCRFLEIDASLILSVPPWRNAFTESSLLQSRFKYLTPLPRSRLVRKVANHRFWDRLPGPRITKRKATEADLDALREHYAPHNQRLGALLGRSLPWQQSRSANEVSLATLQE